MKKKILIASDTLLPRLDGVSSFLNEVIPRLSKDYDITVIAPEFEGDFRGYPGVNVVRFPLIRSIKLGDTFACRPDFFRVLKEVGKCDLVWIQDIAFVTLFSIIAAKIKRKHVVAYIHSLEWELYTNAISAKGLKAGLISGFMKFSDRILYNMCNLLMIPSAEVGEILNWHGIGTEKRILHLGTDTERFSPPKSKEDAKKAIGIDPKSIVIGYAGRIGMEKDIRTLLRAFVRIRRKHAGISLLIAGGGIELIQDIIGKQRNVYLFGRTSYIEKYFRAMDIYVLPSLTETSSLSTMEAMSCGLAVVSTAVGLTREYIKEDNNGMFFPKGDAVALAKKLQKLIGDPSLRGRLGMNARATIKERFSWEKTIAGIREVFDIFLREEKKGD